MKRATIIDVASEAGVGVGTASRALNNQRGVAPATRQAVLAAAAGLGYVPDPLFRRLAARRRRTGGTGGETLAYLYVPEDAVFEEQISDARAACASAGYLMDARAVRAATLARHLRELHARGVEGLLVRSAQGLFPCFPPEWEGRFRLVLMGSHPRFATTKVNFDFAAAILMAVERLGARGRQRVACWLLDDGIQTTHLRAVGMVLALRELPRRRDFPELLLRITTRDAKDFRGVGAWIARCRPDALIGPSPHHLDRLRSLGIPAEQKIPDRVTLYGPASQGVASFGFDMPLLHRIAVRLLSDQLEHETSIPVLHLVSPEWFEALPPGNPGDAAEPAGIPQDS